MLTIYFKSPFTLERLRSGPSGPYLDGFAHKLHLAGYSQGGAQRLVRAAAHLGAWGQTNDNPIQSFSKDTLASFHHHLSSSCCPKPNGGIGPIVFFGAKRFLEYLHQIGVLSPIADEHTDSASPQLMTSFFDWLQQHRGTSQSTCRIYGRVVVDLLQTLGDDPNRFTAADLQAFDLNRAGRHGRSAANNVAKALRMFEEKVDLLLFLAFDIYVECREQIFSLKANEEKNKVFKAFKRAGLISEIADDGPDLNKSTN